MYVDLSICSQCEFGDDLRSSSAIQIGDHNGAQIELAATVQLKLYQVLMQMTGLLH